MTSDTDLNDSLDDMLGGAIVPGATRPAPPASYKPTSFTEACPKCKGSGWWRPGYRCFACKGEGKNTFKTSADQRAKGRVQAKARSVKKAEQFGVELAQYVQANKAEFDWLANAAKRNTQRLGSFGFPQAMLDAVAKYGYLTENQLASVRKLMLRDEAHSEERKAAVANAPVIDVSKIQAAFDLARVQAKAANAQGVRWLKLRLDTFQFLDMPANGKWEAAIRVTEGEVKLGRIANGKFIRFPSCTDEQLSRILAAAADPLAAAKAYGLRFSSCSCCGRELTDPDSIKLGIGPICAEKWFCA